MAYAIKAAIVEPTAERFVFIGQKTMYGGRRIAAGDLVYLFASENAGGSGLVARGIVTASEPVPRRSDLQRQTPRVSIEIQRAALARRALGRRELRAHADWDDGRPETELNFKLYRQATDKIIGISDETAAFLERCF